LTGTPTAPTAIDSTNNTQIATTAFVRAREDIINTAVALKSPIASPTFTGVPAAPTAADGTNTTQLSTTAFVTKAVNNYSATVNTALGLKAPIASPTLTGVPRAPTADSSVSDTQIATTAYVGARIDAKLADDAYLDIKLSDYAKKASPALTGIPTAPLAPAGTNTNQIATTSFIKAAIDSFSNTSNLGQYATLASPSFSGTPTVPTAPVNDNTLKIANTQWIQREFGYASVPKWGGARKFVSTSAPSSSDGVDGDIWFQIES
jgi:hypothetical protein